MILIGGLIVWLSAIIAIGRILRFNARQYPQPVTVQSIMCGACERRYATLMIDGEPVCDGCYLDLEDLGRRFVEDFERWLQTETDPS